MTGQDAVTKVNIPYEMFRFGPIIECVSEDQGQYRRELKRRPPESRDLFHHMILCQVQPRLQIELGTISCDGISLVGRKRPDKIPGAAHPSSVIEIGCSAGSCIQECCTVTHTCLLDILQQPLTSNFHQNQIYSTTKHNFVKRN